MWKHEQPERINMLSQTLLIIYFVLLIGYIVVTVMGDRIERKMRKDLIAFVDELQKDNELLREQNEMLLQLISGKKGE